MGSGSAGDSLTTGKMEVKAAELGRESKAVCTMADTSFDDKGA
jgi:hypothetical protein